MPEIGDREIGLRIGNHSWGYYIYMACPDCGYTRWVAKKSSRTTSGRCRQCFGITQRGKPKLSIRGERNPAWKGGKTLTKAGYVRTSIYVDDPYFSMAMIDKRGGHYWITEHRHVMAKHLGRCLKSWEIVHHKNGNRADNRIENLEMLPKESSRQTHMAFTLLQQENAKLNKRISDLEARVTMLEAERILVEASV